MYTAFIEDHLSLWVKTIVSWWLQLCYNYSHLGPIVLTRASHGHTYLYYLWFNFNHYIVSSTDVTIRWSEGFNSSFNTASTTFIGSSNHRLHKAPSTERQIIEKMKCTTGGKPKKIHLLHTRRLHRNLVLPLRNVQLGVHSCLEHKQQVHPVLSNCFWYLDLKRSTKFMMDRSNCTKKLIRNTLARR